MPDLHGWITQQIDKAQRTAEAASGQGDGQWSHDASYPNGYVYDGGVQPIVYDESTPSPEEAEHIAANDPAAVLRRCEADRRILARHRLNPNAYWADAAMCHGCGTEGEMDYARTDNLNDCPELLDLAHAHGITPEILASLDRPQEGERPAYPGATGNVVVDSIASALIGLAMNTTPIREVPAALRGPNWRPGP